MKKLKLFVLAFAAMIAGNVMGAVQPGEYSLAGVTKPGNTNRYSVIADGIFLHRGASSPTIDGTNGLKTQNNVAGIVFHIDQPMNLTATAVYTSSNGWQNVTANIKTITAEIYSEFVVNSSNNKYEITLSPTEYKSFEIEVTGKAEFSNTYENLPAGYYYLLFTTTTSNTYVKSFNLEAVTASTPVTSVTLDGAETAYIGTATTITATTDVPADEYKWFVDGAEQQDETAKTFNFTPTEAKTYAITCQARNEYNNDAWVASAALNITASKLCGELIKATHTGKTTADVEGLIGGTVDKNTQDGGKLGSNGHYFGVKLSSGVFKAGDEITIVASKLEGGNNATIYSDKGETLLGNAPINEETMTATYTLTQSTEWIYVYRTDGNICNPTISYISVTRDCDESAKLSVSPAEITLNATAAEPTVSAIVTVSGKNLIPNTYNFTMPQVAGLTINPASVTVGEDGFLSEIVTISYTSEANVAATSTTIDLSIGSLTEHITVNYSADMVRNYATSLNIEQLVLDNGKGYDIAGAFAEHNLDAGFTFNSNNALDSLDNKDYRNYPYLGLKLKTSGATIGLWLKQGSTLNVRLGNMGADVKVSGAGEEETLTADQYANIDNDADNKVYTYTAADADAYVLFTTTGSGTTVFKQIMIDEDIKVVTLPGDGNTGSGLDNVNVELNLNAPMYNVLGVQVDSNYNGIVIQNGKKFMLK